MGIQAGGGGGGQGGWANKKNKSIHRVKQDLTSKKSQPSYKRFEVPHRLIT